MKTNIIFVISTVFLGIVSVILFYSVASLKSENDKLRNVVRNQAEQISVVDRQYNDILSRGNNVDSPMYKALDSSIIYK